MKPSYIELLDTVRGVFERTKVKHGFEGAYRTLKARVLLAQYYFVGVAYD